MADNKRQESSDQRLISNPEMQERHKGGLITMPFIIANESFEKVAGYGLIPNMILYLIRYYHMGVAKGTNILFFWQAATNFTPILGAFVADTYLGRFLTIGFGSISSLLGMILLWLTAMVPQSKPPPCDIMTQSCRSPTAGQKTLLFSSLVLISIGAGGVRPCSLAFGADQLDRRDNPKNERVLERFFGWYYASAAISVLIALTGIVYIQDHFGYGVGFGVPAILMLISVLVFFLASPLYIKQMASKSLVTGFVQVFVVAYKNRNLSFPLPNSIGCYHHKRDSNIVEPTDNLRFLNKACIIKNREQDVAPDGWASNPWSLSTVDQVEELKALIKVLPLWSTGIIMSINLSQNTFPVLQASSMDRHLTKKFQIPAGSYGMFNIISLALWVILYDRAILPLISKIKGKPVRIGVKLRMGIGLFLTCIAMVVSAIVENARRREAIRDGFQNNPQAVLKMSAMWLVPQFCLNGLAEAFTAIGQTEFFYSELPKSMSSIAAALFGLGLAVANLLASVVVSIIDDITSKGSKDSWVSSNINKGRIDNYYWVLATLSFINLFYYLLCAWAYGPPGRQATEVKVLRGDELSNIQTKVKGLEDCRR
ncbi:Protein NRT1/ PTR FAMILY 1.2 [Hibiscus syriacus]|uniref:Protein NRT1/ PTR FAMILY 1.2 n=1 Tax=Hibiscus syriacus TaxID=106335 RepID=A0A6A2ZAY8_HIBSY|nr:protein NRT1/ PTR FAMILY 1.2-like [Hibiscus syriacus]KAE8688569.1 Protein NRT1/ PTR FAMILY 1.2 [Hibiscus syriacus]